MKHHLVSKLCRSATWAWHWRKFDIVFYWFNIQRKETSSAFFSWRRERDAIGYSRRTQNIPYTWNIHNECLWELVCYVTNFLFYFRSRHFIYASISYRAKYIIPLFFFVQCVKKTFSLRLALFWNQNLNWSALQLLILCPICSKIYPSRLEFDLTLLKTLFWKQN